MLKGIAKTVGTAVLITIFSAGASLSQIAADKTRIMAQLAQATKTQFSVRVSSSVKSNHDQTAQIALDLIVYRWLVRSSDMPLDVANIQSIIPALTKEIGDPTIIWAMQIFSPVERNAGTITLPPTNDERVPLLSDLQREYRTAVDYKESHPVEAVNSLKELVTICQKLHLDLSEAIICKELGDHYLYDMALYRQADKCYSGARWTFPAYNCVQSAAILYDDYGTLNVETELYTSAAEYYILAAQQWLSLASQDSSEFRYRDRAGQEFMKAGEAFRAAGQPDKALDIMTTYGLYQLRTWAYAAKSYPVLITNLITVAQLYLERGNIPRALGLLQEAKNASLINNDALLTARTYSTLSEVYAAAHQTNYSTEAKHKREQVLREAASKGEAAILKLEKSPSAVESTRMPLYAKAEKGASAYSALGDPQKCADLWQRIAAAYSKAGMSDKMISSMRVWASVLDEQEKPQRSLEIRRDAAMEAIKAGKKTLAADIVQDMVQAFIDIGDLQNAVEGFTELVPIIEASGNVRGATRVLEARGILLAKNRHFDEAIRDLQDARIRYMSQVGDLWSASNVSLELAAAQKSAGRADEARNTLKAGIDEIESRSQSENLDPTINFKRSQLVMNLYAELATAYVRVNMSPDAEEQLRKAKRYSWLPDLINQLKADRNPFVSKFAKSFDIMGGNTIPGETNTLSGERLLAQNWSAYIQTCWMLSAQHSSAYKCLPVNPLDLYTMRASLPKLGSIVEYMVTDTSTYVFVCKYDKPICREIAASRQDVEKLVSELRKSLKDNEESQNAGVPVPPIYDWQGSAFTDISKPLAELYNLLITPIKPDIETAQMLYFALPSELSGLPMHALIKPGSDETPKFLINEYGVSYLAEGMLDNLVDGASDANSGTERLAIFADPQNNLPGAQEEAKAIKTIYLNSQWYVGKNATAASFLAECEKAGIIHVAAHHRTDLNPAKFELMLAPQGQSDGSITMEELSTIANPHLDLVVLSACDSIASSDPISSGTSRAAEVFSMVGAKSILGGLWKVSDEAATKVMSEFYRNLSKGESKTQALRSAQLATIQQKQFAHPFYWACFALYGSPW
ncbi:MAG: CHAT domain-containing protein [Armatimonadota bacterium]|nr:CHAT domain-containing protein [bacterium]